MKKKKKTKKHKVEESRRSGIFCGVRGENINEHVCRKQKKQTRDACAAKCSEGRAV